MLFYFIVGGLSAADWSVQRLGDDGLMPVSDGPAVAAFAFAATAVPDIPSSGGVTLSGRQSKVLENRDLCRIVASYSLEPL